MKWASPKTLCYPCALATTASCRKDPHLNSLWKRDFFSSLQFHFPHLFVLVLFMGQGSGVSGWGTFRHMLHKFYEPQLNLLFCLPGPGWITPCWIITHQLAEGSDYRPPAFLPGQPRLFPIICFISSCWGGHPKWDTLLQLMLVGWGLCRLPCFWAW